MTELTRKQRLEAADARMSGHLAEAARAWWGMGHVCQEVERDELFREAGFDDVVAWAHGRHGLRERTVRKAMEVAAHFSAEMAEAHGSEKLASTLAYLETTNKVEKAGDATALSFKVQREGKFRAIPFGKASYRDIDEARRLVELARRPKPAAPDADLTARAEMLAQAIGPVPRGGKGQRVEVRREADGKQRLTFKSIEPDELESFARAILASLGMG